MSVNHHLVLRYLIVNYWGIYCVGPAMSVGSLLYIKLFPTAATAPNCARRELAVSDVVRGLLASDLRVRPKRLSTYNDIGCEVVPLT